MMSTPSAPNFSAAAEMTGDAAMANMQQQTWANRPTQNTPWAQQSWSSSQVMDDAGNPVYDQSGNPLMSWQQDLNLRSELNDAVDSQSRMVRDRSQMAEGVVGRMANDFASGPDFSGVPSAGTSVSMGPIEGNIQMGNLPSQVTRVANPNLQTDLGNSQRYVQAAGDSLYSQATSRLDPQWQQREEQARTRLYNQGLREGDEAFDQQMQQLGQQRNDAYQQAQWQATAGAGQEASRFQGMDLNAGNFTNQALGQGFNQGLAGAQFQNQARQQAFGERQQQAAFQNQAAQQRFGADLQSQTYQNQLRQAALAEEMQRRGWNLNEAQALLSGQQVGMPQTPSFQAAGVAQAPNYLGAAQAQHGANMDAFAAQQAQIQGLMGGGMNLGMGLFGL